MKTNKILLCMFLSCSLPALAALKPDVELKLEPQQSTLIYSYDEMFNFDIESYLASQAPHLLPYAEVISHWSGYSSISPKVLLTLIEQQTGLLSQQQNQLQSASTMLEQPFGKLSTKKGFAEQFQDIADKLANKVYANEAHPGASEFGGKITPQIAQFDALFVADASQTDKQRQQYDKSVTAFSDLYYKLFQEEFSPLDTRSSPNKASTQAVNGFLQFPFPVGQSWHVGGAHTNTGSGNYPMSSLDMSVGGGWGSNQSNVWVASSAQG